MLMSDDIPSEVSRVVKSSHTLSANEAPDRVVQTFSCDVCGCAAIYDTTHNFVWGTAVSLECET